MTTATLITRDQRARTALDKTIREALQSPSPRDVSVAARDNHSGEPALYVYVTMPATTDIPDTGTQNQLILKMIGALEQIDDDRFPYLYFGPREESQDEFDEDVASGRSEDSA